MRSPNEQLADALEGLREVERKIGPVFKGSEIDKKYLRTLLENGYATSIIKGWYHASRPEVPDGDTTPWAMNCWTFIARYCSERFGDTWVLGPEASLLHHAEMQNMPRQVVVQSPSGGNNLLRLPHGHSLLDLKKEMPPPEQVMQALEGLRIYTPAATLMGISENSFTTFPAEVSALLATFSKPDPIINLMVNTSKPVVSGRIVGAFRHLGMESQASNIENTARRFRIDLRVSNPFIQHPANVIVGKPAIANRLMAFWQKMAPVVSDIIPPPKGNPGLEETMRQVDETYKLDAWHSLSIEGYRVTDDMIERIRCGHWNPEEDSNDKRSKDALAAKGYYDAFREVRATISDGVAAGAPVDVMTHLHNWYQALFMPSVNAGILKPHQLIGYRNHPVFIQTARHVPPRVEALLDAMDAYSDLLQSERNPAVRAILGHWMLGYIHPFPDGNGRLARFVMNSMLVTGGYDWTVIRLNDRAQYMRTLDQASYDGDIRPFAEFVRHSMRLEPEEPDGVPGP